MDAQFHSGQASRRQCTVDVCTVSQGMAVLLCLLCLAAAPSDTHAAVGSAAPLRRPSVSSHILRGKPQRANLACRKLGLLPQWLSWRNLSLRPTSQPDAGGQRDGEVGWDTVPLAPDPARHYQAVVGRSRLKPPQDRLPECGLLNLSSPLRGDFVKDDSARRVEYQIRGCKLRRMEPADVRACFSGRHIAFVGDSLSRFQFLALAHLLTNGRFQRPHESFTDGLTLVPPDASVIGSDQFADSTPGQAQGDRVVQVDPEGAGSGGMRSGAAAFAAWTQFYEQTTQQLSRPGCVNVTCNCYRNPTDHAPGQDPLSRAREYWRVRVDLEDRPPAQLSMGLVYAFPDFATAGVNGLRWAFSAAPRRPPDMIVLNMGLWWGYLHGRNPSETSIAHVVAAFEEIFHWGQRHVKEKGMRTRLVYKTTTPVADAQDNFWWKVWPTRVEPLLIHLARAYGWEVFDAREVVAAAYKQSLVAAWDSVHLLPFMYEQLNDLMLNAMCHPEGVWASRPFFGLRPPLG